MASKIVNGIGTLESRRGSGWVRFGCFDVKFRTRLTFSFPLGYGATPLPALTEAITIEKNVTLANYEVIRLTEAVEKIAVLLRA